MWIKRSMLFVFVILLASSAFAASSYYVDNSIAASGNGSQRSPWKNLSDINWITIKGASKPCMIYLSGGATTQTYGALNVNASGTSRGNEIIIKRPTSAEWPGHSGMVYIVSLLIYLC